MCGEPMTVLIEILMVLGMAPFGIGAPERIRTSDLCPRRKSIREKIYIYQWITI